MNEALMQIVVDCAVFFELSEDDCIDLDIAVQQLEQMKYALQQLLPEERAELRRYIQRQAIDAERSGVFARRLECLKQLLEALGLENRT